MYAQHFGLSKDPFSIAPDPRFLFMSEKHREALAHLLYGVAGGGGFVLLTGEIGAGKTTVCRAFLEQIPEHCDVAYIFNPKLTVPELLQTICDEFHVTVPAPPAGSAPTVKTYVDALNAYLLAAHAAGRSAVLIIDEAQSLAPEVLEQLRLLTNLETHERKLLQIILIGQPELRDMLEQPGMEQLAQRVIARCHLGRLTAAETVRYVQHRLAVAGGSAATMPFEPDAMARLYQLTGGVPRRINLLAGRSMLGAYAHGRALVDRATVDKAGREVFGTRRGVSSRRLAGASRSRAREGADSRLGRDGREGRDGRDGRDSREGRGSGYGRDAADAPRRAALALAVGAGIALGLVVATWVWRDARQGAGAADAVAAAASSTLPAGRAPATAAAGSATPVVAAAGSGAAAGGGVAGAALAPAGAGSAAAPLAKASGAAGGAAAAAIDERFDDPAMVMAAAWTEEASAWRALAMAWKTPLQQSDPCAAAVTAGLACFRTRGGLATVRQIDRPGVLALRQRDEPPVHVLLVALDERGATLQTQGRHWRVALPALAAVWKGDYATLWRTPPGWREGSEAALRAPTRTWLREQLAASGLGSATMPLRERIWAYQVAQGLPPDGRAGPMTMMQLVRASGVAEPALTAER